MAEWTKGRIREKETERKRKERKCLGRRAKLWKERMGKEPMCIILGMKYKPKRRRFENSSLNVKIK